MKIKTYNPFFLSKVKAYKKVSLPKSLREKFVSFLIIDYNSEIITVKFREKT